MKQFTFSTGLISAILVLSSCGSKNSDVQGEAEKADSVTRTSAVPAMTDPKINVLFVVDNSGSMKGYQEKLAKNMRLFSNRFFANSRINYRIGVVPVYDSKYLNDETEYRSGKRKMNALAELVPLKGLSAEDTQNQLFITRSTINPQNVLEQTVAIGTQWGPEAEESFSPVLAIADPVINAEKNQGFYDKDAYLAVIFLTDADDVTPGLSGEDFYRRLVEMKGGDRSKIFIAAALPNLNNKSSGCTTDGRGPLQSFPALLAVSGALFADLCSQNFGSYLADFGQYLVQRVATQIIPLQYTPDIATLHVTYGPADSLLKDRLVIPRGPEGYLFNSENNQVIISPNFKTVGKQNWIIFVEAKKANLANAENGRLKEAN